jgi:radical SAM enzyme (TIGR01210 family)
MTTVQELVIKIRRRSFNRPKVKHRIENPQEYISAWLENDILAPSGPVVSALVVILRTHGCSWASGDAGGCSMCGYINDCLSTEIVLKPEDIITQFQAAVKKFPNKQTQFIKIFTSGSFLDENEVPFSSQKHILEICNDLSVESVLIESRPEFITREKLAKLTCNK